MLFRSEKNAGSGIQRDFLFQCKAHQPDYGNGTVHCGSILSGPDLCADLILHGTCGAWLDFSDPAATGIYHVGFHAISDANKYYLHLKSYSISAPISASAPEAVENVSVKASSSDCFKAEISFKAPSKTIAGDALTGNVKVKVLRGETLVAEESLAPGATKSLVDNTVVNSDTYIYSFIPVNAAGEEGKTVTVAAFIGAAKPGQAGDFAGYSAGNKVNLSWTAPTVDADGNALVAPSLTYKIGRASCRERV